ncbi:hypothetical protein IE53DRAFT_370348 [Violaceomyces palustris]|uniref:Uncharacterized protein n=1 Tax=Violaceomyces palustris TaxID=1673888 RepID=A0ACD0NSE1_9BASI|nr:hypothetical protein IE53DRAFT_370348 [Violaceomyces palustris]
MNRNLRLSLPLLLVLSLTTSNRFVESGYVPPDFLDLQARNDDNLSGGSCPTSNPTINFTIDWTSCGGDAEGLDSEEILSHWMPEAKFKGQDDCENTLTMRSTTPGIIHGSYSSSESSSVDIRFVRRSCPNLRSRTITIDSRRRSVYQPTCSDDDFTDLMIWPTSVSKKDAGGERERQLEQDEFDCVPHRGPKSRAQPSFLLDFSSMQDSVQFVFTYDCEAIRSKCDNQVPAS